MENKTARRKREGYHLGSGAHDTKEQIQKCLNCEKIKCTNCMGGKKKKYE